MTIEVSNLAATGLGVTPERLEELFAPFVAARLEADDPRWRKEAARRRRKTLRQALRRMLLGRFARAGRDEATVRQEYERGWSGIDYGRYAPDAPLQGATPWLYRGRRMLATDTGATRVRQLLLVRIVERLRPRSVLEVGCGNGINLLLLSCRFPQIAFSGLELTEAGHHAAVAFQDMPALPGPMQAFAPEPLRDASAFRNIRFVHGNAADMPFEDGAFDLVYTTLALEQMEQVRAAALGEIARVCARNTLMIEPFADVNADLWPRLYVYRRNYFRGRIADLDGYGLKPVLATDDFPQELLLKACAVLADKAVHAAGD
jgi:SAM-dependent methyltransferase